MECVCVVAERAPLRQPCKTFSPQSVTEFRYKSCWGAFQWARYRVQQRLPGGLSCLPIVAPELRAHRPSADHLRNGQMCHRSPETSTTGMVLCTKRSKFPHR